MIKTFTIAESLSILQQKLDSNNRVFFTRFGDNDIMMVSGRDCKGSTLIKNQPYGGNRTIWSPELQKELFDSFIIQDNDYLKGVSCTWQIEEGMRKGVFAPFKYNIVLDKKIKLLTQEREFLIPILFHYLVVFKPIVFDNFVNQYIKPYPKLFIGSVRKELVEKMIGKVDYYVKVPPETAYSKIGDWWTEVRRALDKHSEIKVIIPTAGQCSRVIQNLFYKISNSAFYMNPIYSLDREQL